MPEVSLDLDTEDLARRYEQVSAERQFRGGQELLRELALAPSEHVLDIGCGTGMLAEYAAGLVGPGGSVLGLDPLPLRIELAQKRSAPNLKFRVGNAFDLGDLADSSFDVAYMNAVFHWLPEKLGPLREVRRVLKPGGRFALSAPARDAHSWMHAIRKRVLTREPYNQHAEVRSNQSYRVTVEELELLLHQAGFEIVKLESRTRVRNAAARAQWTPESALEFAEASSFGNFLGHLPAELQQSAREEIKRELESLRTRRRPDDVPAPPPRAQAGRIIAVAHRPR